MMNKKGAEKLLSVYWFVILVLVAGGIYGMVYVFYSHPFDVRGVEADLLADAVADCLSQNGRFVEGVFLEGKINPEFKENFLERCGITFEVEKDYKWDERHQYYIKINFLSIGKKSIDLIEEGNPSLLGDCKELDSEEFSILSQCTNKRFYALDGGTQILVDVSTSVRKTEKNVNE